MEIPVYFEGQVRGSASLSQDGLYTKVQVTAQDLPDQICRAYGLVNGNYVLIGVLFPEGKQWRTSKRFSTASLAPALEQCEILCETPRQKTEAPAEDCKPVREVWQDYRKPLMGCELHGAKYRANDTGTEIIFPYDPQISCALVPLFCFFTMTQYQGRPYLRLYLDAAGEPVLPDT